MGIKVKFFRRPAPPDEIKMWETPVSTFRGLSIDSLSTDQETRIAILFFSLTNI